MKATLRTEPQPMLRTRVRVVKGKVISFTPDKSRAAMGVIATLLEKYNFTPYPKHMPLKLKITFHRTQSTWSKKRLKDKSPFRKPDLDNYVVLWQNASKGILFEDDAQIVNVKARKVWSDRKKGYITFELKEV